MIRIIQANDMGRFPRLMDGMFRDRAAQFVNRLGWEIGVDTNGREVDQYDALDPIYLICEGADGRHDGSMRFLPTFGRTMLAEHFAYLTTGPVTEPNIWECTRLVIRPGAPVETSAKLLLGALDLGLDRGWAGSLGVFDARMMRVYGRLGWPPEMLAQDGVGRDALCLGRWRFDPALRAGLAHRAEMSIAA